jgi:hypothetical protein
MWSRIVAVLSLAALCAAAAPPPKPKPQPPPNPQPQPKLVAPDSFPHAVALFLSSLSSGGQQRVQFKAAALGTRFFFEEPTGVSVYQFDGVGYRRQSFLKGNTLGQALAKYNALPRKPPPKTAVKTK